MRRKVLIGILLMCLVLGVISIPAIAQPSPPASQESGDSIIEGRKVLENFPVFSQGLGKPWCAWACAQMVLKYYGYDVTQETIAEKTFGYGGGEWKGGSLKKWNLLFSIDAEFEDDLNKEGIISNKLKKEFETKGKEFNPPNGFPLSEVATVTKEAENEWVINDGVHNNFFVYKEDRKLNIYINRDDCYLRAIGDLSDNSLEIEEIRTRDKEKLFNQIVEAIEDDNPIIVTSNGAWLLDIDEPGYIKHDVEAIVGPHYFEFKWPMVSDLVGHAAVIVGYSFSKEGLVKELPFLGVDPPAIKLHDPAAANLLNIKTDVVNVNLGTYWLSYHAFFEKTTKGDNRYLYVWVVKECEKTKPEIDFNVLLKPDKTTYRRGETAKVTIDVTNNRDQDTEIWLGTTFKDPEGKEYHIPLKRALIPKGETESFDRDWAIPADAPSGQYEIAVNCYKDAGQNEDYTDNIVWAPVFTVEHYGIKPDLTISSLSWNPKSAGEGAELTISYTIKNQGTEKAEPSKTVLFIDGEKVCEDDVNSLDSSSYTKETFGYKWKATAGRHNIRVVADYYGNVEESEEGNNEKTGTLLTGGGDTPEINDEFIEIIDEIILWWNENKDDLFKAVHEFINELFKLIDELISEYEKEK